ncbi:hypothetical protein FPV16_06930 [Methylobacterium sp. W2]|uniref:hypothetical protein n=1 Tax=Methylobacterium sp. W2 TaxID=2598107 RepID=UPI001D0C853E|nr:hypothetical protein [Methylobacterium sp. W2]MCC0805959.1 hypothetical protein [Methylobacterium sp. W2]
MNIPAPTPSINIKISETPTEITMFFGRLHELAELVGSFEQLPNLDFDASTRAAALEICLAPRDALGRRTDDEPVSLYDLTISDGEALLDWMRAHLSDFLLGRLEKHLANLTSNAERLTGVGSSLSGLAVSASTTP